MEEFYLEVRKFQLECETEAIRLIERGIPPWDAIEKARFIVLKKRANYQCSRPQGRRLIVDVSRLKKEVLMKHSGPGIRPGNHRAAYSVQDKNYDNVETLKRENRELKKEIERLKNQTANYQCNRPAKAGA